MTKRKWGSTRTPNDSGLPPCGTQATAATTPGPRDGTTLDMYNDTTQLPSVSSQGLTPPDLAAHAHEWAVRSLADAL